MRDARFLLAVAAALTLGGCLHREAATSYVIDPATGQPVPVVQSYAQPQYAQGAYGQSAYGQPQYAPQAGYAQQQYAPQGYAQPQAASSTGERGLFNLRRKSASAQPVVQQPYVMQYTPPQQYAAQSYPAQQYAAQQYARPLASAQYPAQYASPAQAYAYAYAPAEQPYTLDSGDRLRIVVFGQDGISNSYIVDAGGYVNLPLIGMVPARGYSTQQLSQAIAERLKQGYVREPHVSVEVETYRPFFILGEVTTPGQYPYVANMTAEAAVAIAGGFAPRAKKTTVTLTRNTPWQRYTGDVPLNTPLRPGDTIVVKERWF